MLLRGTRVSHVIVQSLALSRNGSVSRILVVPTSLGQKLWSHEVGIAQLIQHVGYGMDDRDSVPDRVKRLIYSP
jgi:hypothetical protein